MVPSYEARFVFGGGEIYQVQSYSDKFHFHSCPFRHYQMLSQKQGAKLCFHIFTMADYFLVKWGVAECPSRLNAPLPRAFSDPAGY